MQYDIDRVAKCLNFAGLPPICSVSYDKPASYAPMASRIKRALLALEDHYGIIIRCMDCGRPDHSIPQIGARIRKVENLQREITEQDGPVEPIREAEGFRLLWTIRDAIVVWLSHPDRINARWTCGEIADGLSDDARFFFGPKLWSDKINAAQVNAAFAGISIRVKCSAFVTDIDTSSGQSVHAKPEDGLKTHWKVRRWQLTPQGIARARLLSRVRNRVLDDVEQRRAIPSLEDTIRG